MTVYRPRQYGTAAELAGSGVAQRLLMKIDIEKRNIMKFTRIHTLDFFYFRILHILKMHRNVIRFRNEKKIQDSYNLPHIYRSIFKKFSKIREEREEKREYDKSRKRGERREEKKQKREKGPTLRVHRAETRLTVYRSL